MPKIRIYATVKTSHKSLSSAMEKYIKHCRFKTLSLHTIEYCREDLDYFSRYAPSPMPMGLCGKS